MLLCGLKLKPKGKMESIENKSALRIEVVLSKATLFTSCAIPLVAWKPSVQKDFIGTAALNEKSKGAQTILLNGCPPFLRCPFMTCH
jgi:hypothetical protein